MAKQPAPPEADTPTEEEVRLLVDEYADKAVGAVLKKDHEAVFEIIAKQLKPRR